MFGAKGPWGRYGAGSAGLEVADLNVGTASQRSAAAHVVVLWLLGHGGGKSSLVSGLLSG